MSTRRSLRNKEKTKEEDEPAIKVSKAKRVTRAKKVTANKITEQDENSNSSVEKKEQEDDTDEKSVPNSKGTRSKKIIMNKIIEEDDSSSDSFLVKGNVKNSKTNDNKAANVEIETVAETDITNKILEEGEDNMDKAKIEDIIGVKAINLNKTPESNINISKNVTEDDGSSSDSSVENYLTKVDEIDLNSSFFSLQNLNPDAKIVKKKVLPNVDRLSDTDNSDSENEVLRKKIKSEEANVVEIKLEGQSINFQELEDYNRKIEEAKSAVLKYQKSHKAPKKEKKLDISDLLSAGEKSLESSMDMKEDYMDSSSENEMDWEEVEDKKTLSQTIPKEGVQITVELPTLIRKKKEDDYLSIMKRRINRIKKENQVYMHKVHLLCWIAHGNYVNSILNNENLLGLSLSLLPSEQCYPPKHADLSYLEQITKWYSKVIKLVEKKMVKIPDISLEQILRLQLTRKVATSQKNYVLLFICILRALGLQCRLVLSLRCLPFRPPSSELCSLSKKEDKDGKKEKTEGNEKGEASTSDIKGKKSEAATKNDLKKKVNISNLKKSPAASKKEEIQSKISPIKSSPSKSTSSSSKSTLNKDSPRTSSPNKVEIKSNTRKKSAESDKEINKKNSSSRKSESDTKSDKETRKKVSNTSKKSDTDKKTDKDIRSSARNKKDIKKSTEDLVEKAHCSKQVTKPNIKNLKVPPKNSRNAITSQDDSEDDFRPDKRTSFSSPEKRYDRNKSSLNTSTSSSKGLDVRNDIINLVKGTLTTQKHAERQKLTKSRRKPAQDESEDSDYMPEPVKKPKTSRRSSSDDEFKKKNKVKVKQRVKPRSQLNVDSRVLSTDDEKEKKEKVGNDVWAEVFLEAEEKWISVDVVKCQVHCISELHSRASTPVSYILAWNNNLSIKDVTCRYCPHWNTVTRKLRIDATWWTETMKPYIGKKSARDKDEDEDLARQQLDQPLPKTIGEYKNHPLYALKRHLLKFEAIYPPDALTLGFVRNEPVYARECVHTLHSREIWIKHAKVVKPAQEPYKIVKARPKYDRSTGTMITDKPLEIFGIWQVDDYVPPTAENGVVPRNAFGNVELFKPCMLPGGTVHLQLPGLNKVCRRLGIDCAPALVGFDFHSGGTHPTFDGYIVCEEFKEKLIVAWEEEQEEIVRREREKIEKRVYDNWRKLIKGVLIREKLKIKYEFEGPSGSGKGTKKKSKGPRFVAKRRRVISGSESNSN